MRFSIIIATCSRPERLRVTLERVARAVEAHGGWDEILVVDNSPEGRVQQSEVGGRKSDVKGEEEEVCSLQSVVSGLPTRWLRSKPLNKCAALNVGIEAAANEWIAFTDDDCLPEKGWLVAADAFAKEGVACVFGGRIRPVPDAAGVPSWLTPGRRGLVPEHGSVVRYEPPRASGIIPNGVRKPLGANFFCRKDVFEDYGKYDEELWNRCGAAAIGCDDGEMMLRLDQRGEAVGYCAEAVVDHPMYADRATLKNHLRAAFRLGYREPIVGDGAFSRRWLIRLLVSNTGLTVLCLLSRDRAAAVHYSEKLAMTCGTVVCLLRRRKPL